MIGAEIRCTRRIQFCAGHRVLNHESKCANPHGHNYVALFTAVAPALDGIGRVIDFSVLKEKLGGWIDRYWDHKFIFNEQDVDMHNALNAFGVSEANRDRDFCWMAPFNPTAEEMARYLLEHVAPRQLEGTGVRVVRVELWETENCSATVEVRE